MSFKSIRQSVLGEFLISKNLTLSQPYRFKVVYNKIKYKHMQNYSTCESLNQAFDSLLATDVPIVQDIVVTLFVNPKQRGQWCLHGAKRCERRFATP